MSVYENRTKKYLVKTDATVYIVVEAESPEQATHLAFEEHGSDEWEVDGIDDFNPRIEEYAY